MGEFHLLTRFVHLLSHLRYIVAYSITVILGYNWGDDSDWSEVRNGEFTGYETGGAAGEI